MVETVFDTLNAKAALFAIEELFEARGARLPVMVSGTITDASGRTLSGQTAEAFWYSLRHAQPLAIGLNCALGATDLRAHVDVLSQVADAYVSTHPERRPAERVRRLRRNARRHGRRAGRVRREPACSTWSAAAAARRPRTSPRSPTRCATRAARARRAEAAA